MENMVNDILTFYRGKKVLITGHTGFKGTWLVRILLMAGANVNGYSLAPPTYPSLFDLTNSNKHINSYYGDIRDIGNLLTIVQRTKPEIVFHLAAQPIVRRSYLEPVETYSINVMGTVNLLEAIRKSTSVMSCVNITTDKVYLNREWDWGYRENEELCGFDPYSNSKSCSELVTYSYKNAFFTSDNAPSISTARSGNVIGGGDFAENRIIPDCVRAALANEVIVVRNPYSVRPYQHVLDCLSGYLLLAKKQTENKKYAGSYNFGPSSIGCISTGLLVQQFCEVWGKLLWREQGDNGPHEANFLKLDCSKARTVLGWDPKWDLRKAIMEIVTWTKGYQCKLDLVSLMEAHISEYFRINGYAK